jgi:hypothetical protein
MADKHVDNATIGQLLGKAVKDSNFRKKLLSDPAAAMKDMHIEPDPDAVAFFRSLSSKNFDEAAKSVKKTSKLFSGEAGLGEAEAGV